MHSEPMCVKNVKRIRLERVRALGKRGVPATAADAMRLLGSVPSMVLRDKALLLVGFAGAFRRGEVTNLQWGDVTISAEGAVIRLRRSKTDPLGLGKDVGIPYGQVRSTCPGPRTGSVARSLREAARAPSSRVAGLPARGALGPDRRMSRSRRRP